MIIVYHKNNKVVEVEHQGETINFSSLTITQTLIKIARLYKDELLVWCNFDLKSSLNFEQLPNIFHHNKILASYNATNHTFLLDAIGYVEESPFIKVNKKVTYPTWQMSGDVGGVHTSVLVSLHEQLVKDKNFDYFLNSLAKLAMPNGLLCYSSPELLKDDSKKSKEKTVNKNNKYILFQFVKQHYRLRWTFLLFLNLFLYERKLEIFPLIFSLFYKRRKLSSNSLDDITVMSKNKVVELGTIDVIIPTIGRKQYLYDVLKDLSNQTQLPKKVIIVEQNPAEDSLSELNYIQDEKWPFLIKHVFTHQAGVCNARNVALSFVESEWVFLNDDDNRFESNLLSEVLSNLKTFGIKCLSTSYLQFNEIKLNREIHQAGIFGSGNSFIHSSLLKHVKFNMKFEFGYSEDSDFGMQLRNNGVDVLYFPNIEITHLKAPIGGFRTKPILAWQNDPIQPKPSPTVMLNKQLNFSQKQIKGYKTILFFKFYKLQTITNPVLYFRNFNKRWKQSLYWANKLNARK